MNNRQRMLLGLLGIGMTAASLAMQRALQKELEQRQQESQRKRREEERRNNPLKGYYRWLEKEHYLSRN